MDRAAQRFERPPIALLALEGMRATAELATTAVLAPFAKALPRGDGRPVFVLPGFTASDRSTAVLRRFLTELGYETRGWNLGRNLGPTQRAMSGVLDGFSDIRRRAGQPVTVIGWSLGGLYARALAQRSPADVRHVITMGSPFRMASRADSHAGTLYRALSVFHVRPMDNYLRQRVYTGPPPVPTTSIFSRTDGVVPWEACVDDIGDQNENIEVHAAHVGLGHHAAVLRVIADRLALATWRPYAPSLAERLGHSAVPYEP
jgi:pimeloyl-ACP methyl ester carboxylesterase